jgi:hypothetical protein
MTRRSPPQALALRFRTLSARLSVHEMRLIEQAAQQLGVTKSVYVRLQLGLDSLKDLRNVVAASNKESGDGQ